MLSSTNLYKNLIDKNNIIIIKTEKLKYQLTLQLGPDGIKLNWKQKNRNKINTNEKYKIIVIS